MTGEFAVAVHALVFLDHKRTTQNSEALAENICTNPARVRKVMAKLKKAGLVATKEGADGGYLLLADAAAIDLAQVFAAVESRVVAAGWRSGDEDMDCLIAAGMANIMDDIYADLDALCKERLSRITIAAIEQRIFGG